MTNGLDMIREGPFKEQLKKSLEMYNELPDWVKPPEHRTGKPTLTKDDLEWFYGLVFDALDYDSDYSRDTQEALKPIKAKLEKILDIDPVKEAAERDDVV